MRHLKTVIFCLLFMSLLTIGFIYLRYGGHGKVFPDLSTTPVLPSSQLEAVAELQEPPGNLAVSKTGRIFFTYHAESRPDIKVLELIDGKPTPYPNSEMQTYNSEKPSFDSIFSIRIDSKNRLWTLDHGFHGLRQPRIMAFDLDTNQLVQDFVFPKAIAGLGSFIEDMQIDFDARKIYIADIGMLAKKPGLIIYDVEKKIARRVLDSDKSLEPEPYEINSKGRKMYLLGGLYWVHPGFDPIALDRKGEWLYFGPMSGKTLYRARTEDLNNVQLSKKNLSSRVEIYAQKNQCDGLTIDNKDNIYITGIEQGSIFRLGANRKLQTLIQSEKLRWPDGLSFGPDGWIYISDSDFPDLIMKSKEHIRESGPFYIYRFQSQEKALPGQ